MSRDFRSAVEPGASADVQVSETGVAARACQQPVRRPRRRHEGDAGRTPGALADAERALAFEEIEGGCHVRAGEPAAALYRREIVTEPRLQLLDRRTESGDVAVRKRRQRLDQHEPAQMRGLRVRARRKLAEQFALLRPVHALPLRVEHNEDAPLLGERQAADDRGRRPRRSAPAVDDEAALLEQADADARTRAASEPDGVVADVEGQSMETAQARRHGQRKLRARSETDMGRNHFIDRRVILAAQIETAAHRYDVGPDPLLLGAGHAHLRRRADRYAGAPAADSQADAAEATPEPAVEIQKAEMQPRRNSHGHHRGGSGTTQAFSPEIFPQP